MSSSNYPKAEGAWIYGDPHINSQQETECKACHGSGSDRDGADCIPCEGMGSIPLNFPPVDSYYDGHLI